MGIYIPKEVYTGLEVGKKYEWEVYTDEKERVQKVYTPKKVITEKKFDTQWCEKHEVYKGGCGCK